jgi:hypothetical protein
MYMEVFGGGQVVIMGFKVSLSEPFRFQWFLVLVDSCIICLV